MVAGCFLEAVLLQFFEKTWVHSLIYSLNTYQAPALYQALFQVLETAVEKKKETAVNKTDEHFSLMEFLFKWND